DCPGAAGWALARGVNAPRLDDAVARPGARAGVGVCSQGWIRRSRRPDRLPLVPRSGLVLLAVAGLEAGDAAAGVQDLLLAGVERVARGADLGADDAIRLGAAGGERVSAGAGHLGFDVCGVDP